MSSLALVKAAFTSCSASFIWSVNSLTDSSWEGCYSSNPIRGWWPELRKKGVCWVNKWTWLLYWNSAISRRSAQLSCLMLTNTQTCIDRTSIQRSIVRDVMWLRWRDQPLAVLVFLRNYCIWGDFTFSAKVTSRWTWSIGTSMVFWGNHTNMCKCLVLSWLASILVITLAG